MHGSEMDGSSAARGTPDGRSMPHRRIDRHAAACRSGGPGLATCPRRQGYGTAVARVGVIMRRCAPELDGIGSERPPAPGRRRRRVLAPHGRARPCACRRGSRPVLRPEPGGATGQAQAVRDTGWCSYVRGPARPALLRTAYMAWLGRGSELLGLRARSVFRDGGHMRETPSCLLLTASRAVLSNQTTGGG